MSPVRESAQLEAETAPARRKRMISRSGWIAIAIVVLLVGLGVMAVRAMVGTPNLVGVNSAGPGGHRAIVQLLRDQGVDVRVVDTRAEAASILASTDATLVHGPAWLSNDGLEALWQDAETLVLLQPRTSELELAFEDGSRAIRMDEQLSADCDIPFAENAPYVLIGETYTAKNADTCFDADLGSGLVATTVDGQERFVFDGTALANASLATADNAAFGLGLLGQHETLVWYEPSALGTDSDLGTGQPVTLADYAPKWITPVLVLLAFAAAAAAVWRGRRFGPLVAERLPVTVRASETMEGRAKLYAKSHDAPHAAAILRRETTTRLSRSLGLGRSAAPDAVVNAIAAAIGATPPLVRDLLYGPPPATDRDLVDLSDRLTQLESAVHGAIGIERKQQ